MKIKSGNYEVLYTGTVIGIKDEPIEFNYPDGLITRRIIFKFKNDNTKTESTTALQYYRNTLTIIITNAKTSLGIDNPEEIEFGRNNNKPILFNYQIYSIKGLSKTIHYTFYLKEEVVIPVIPGRDQIFNRV